MNEPGAENTSRLDAIIIGAGPAGRWLGALLVRRGLHIGLIDPAIDQNWPNSYGVWLDEVQSLELPVDMRRTWPEAVVRPGTTDADTILCRPYGRIDTIGMQERLDKILRSELVRRIAGRADGLRHYHEHSTVYLENGDELDARLVIDASGGAADLIEFDGQTGPSFQTAYGIEATLRGDPLGGRSLVLMDYTPPKQERSGNALRQSVPTFLYGMHLKGPRYFIEETALVGRPAVSMNTLQNNLDRRLHARDIEIDEIHLQEHCRIPMGGALPEIGQRTIGFGASAGLVHPATGYQMARMLRAGAALADVIADGLDQKALPSQIAERAWSTLWPLSLQRARALLVFGQSVLLELSADNLRCFIETFFTLPTPAWATYMSAEAAPIDVATIMLRLFKRAPMSLRWSLTQLAARNAAPILQALFSGSDTRQERYYGRP